MKLGTDLRSVLKAPDSHWSHSRLRESYRTASGTMMPHYEEEARSHGVGEPSVETTAHRKTCPRKMATLRAHTVWLRSLKELTRQTEPNMADVVLSQGGATVGVEVPHNYKHAGAGRRYESTYTTHDNRRQRPTTNQPTNQPTNLPTYPPTYLPQQQQQQPHSQLRDVPLCVLHLAAVVTGGHFSDSKVSRHITLNSLPH